MVISCSGVAELTLMILGGDHVILVGSGLFFKHSSLVIGGSDVIKGGYKLVLGRFMWF